MGVSHLGSGLCDKMPYIQMNSIIIFLCVVNSFSLSVVGSFRNCPAQLCFAFSGTVAYLLSCAALGAIFGIDGNIQFSGDRKQGEFCFSIFSSFIVLCALDIRNCSSSHISQC